MFAANKRMTKEIKKIYAASRKKPYSEKEEWEKFLDKDRTRYKRKRKKIMEHEILFSSDKLEYLGADI